MFVQLLGKLFVKRINIPLRLLANLFVKRINIPLRRFAFATRRCPPSKGESLELCPCPIISSKSMEILRVCAYETEPAFSCRPGFGS